MPYFFHRECPFFEIPMQKNYFNTVKRTIFGPKPGSPNLTNIWRQIMTFVKMSQLRHWLCYHQWFESRLESTWAVPTEVWTHELSPAQMSCFWSLDSPLRNMLQMSIWPRLESTCAVPRPIPFEHMNSQLKCQRNFSKWSNKGPGSRARSWEQMAPSVLSALRVPSGFSQTKKRKC